MIKGAVEEKKHAGKRQKPDFLFDIEFHRAHPSSDEPCLKSIKNSSSNQ